jgi:hypothetical protein
MSVADPTTEFARTATEALPVPRPPARTLLSGLIALLAGLIAVVRGAAFWVAALLPLTYVPLLATGVIAGNPFGFLGVATVNGLAFVVGHAHDPVA